MISIIITTYNIEDYIVEAIESALNQSYKDFEVIIVDDNSTDNTLNLVNKYKDNPKVKIIAKSQNEGCGLARRTGIENAKGEWIAFLDGDDKYGEKYLETLYNTAITNDADFITSRYHISFNDYFSEKIDHEILNCTLIKKNLFDRVTYSALRINEDIVVFNELQISCKKKVVSDNCLYYYRKRENSIVNSVRKFEEYLSYRYLSLREYNKFCEKNKYHNVLLRNEKSDLATLVVRGVKYEFIAKYFNDETDNETKLILNKKLK